eukprot:TRINITY_DN5996_c0_g1_i3.p1 TRINITY_DN5996_c0_g1~~TRINITY_DN5996_c0_g1_i3.p1  ORF type:complete len:209 (-),score=87.96 TRINITY_DN5996_c0_g1_i3:268-867(-)
MAKQWYQRRVHGDMKWSIWSWQIFSISVVILTVVSCAFNAVLCCKIQDHSSKSAHLRLQREAEKMYPAFEMSQSKHWVKKSPASSSSSSSSSADSAKSAAAPLPGTIRVTINASDSSSNPLGRASLPSNSDHEATDADKVGLASAEADDEDLEKEILHMLEDKQEKETERQALDALSNAILQEEVAAPAAPAPAASPSN